MHRPGVKLAICRSQVRRPNHYTTEPSVARMLDRPSFKDIFTTFRRSTDRPTDGNFGMIYDIRPFLTNFLSFITKCSPIRYRFCILLYPEMKKNLFDSNYLAYMILVYIKSTLPSRNCSCLNSEK